MEIKESFHDRKNISLRIVFGLIFEKLIDLETSKGFVAVLMKKVKCQREN